MAKPNQPRPKDDEKPEAAAAALQAPAPEPSPPPAPATTPAVVTPLPPPAAPPKTARFRVWPHGTLQRNGKTYQPGDELTLHPDEAASIPCLEKA